MTLPPAAANLVGFARLIRAAGFAVAPEQAVTFMRSVGLLGPRSMDDIREAALATLAPPPDRRREFDALFRAWFWGDAAVTAAGDGEEETELKDDQGAREEILAPVEHIGGGEMASAIEQLAARRFETERKGRDGFSRQLSAALPTRHSFRRVRAPSRGRPDLRRSLRTIVATDGDIPSPVMRRRREIQRPLLLLIDISGSMKLHTADHLRLAHTAVRYADRAEVFTLGTRLTRITAPLRIADPELAMARVAETVEDWDGGTRIGPTLLALLSVPRFAAFGRGASVVVLSDGLERGDHSEMEQAFRRLGARAHRLSLASPLAADPRFRPRTSALKAVLPYLDDLIDGSSTDVISRFILSLGKPARAASDIWREAS